MKSKHLVKVVWLVLLKDHKPDERSQIQQKFRSKGPGKQVNISARKTFLNDVLLRVINGRLTEGS